MADHEQWQQDAKHRFTALDRELDAALATYAAAEPRTGLEERVLANLRTEREQVVRRSWWSWAVVGGLAVGVIVVAATLSWRPANNAAKHHPPTKAHRAAETQVAGNSEMNRTGPTIPKPRKRPSVHLHRTENVAQPKLDVFPSPLPLSQQEKMLASYASHYPKEAALIAQLRTKALQRDFEEETQADANSVH